jgi:DNA gyrase subunit A
MGRNTSGVKGIGLGKGDQVIGMVVADPEATLLTACERGYGKRTFFGPNGTVVVGEAEGESDAAAAGMVTSEPVAEASGQSIAGQSIVGDLAAGEEDENSNSATRYRTQRRGGKGVRDIKTTARNGKVIGIKSVTDEDQLLLMTAGGKMQRIKCKDLNIIGRNTQGVRIMSLDEGDILAVIAVVPRSENDEVDAPDDFDEVLSQPRPTTPAIAAADDLDSEDEIEVDSDEADQEGDVSDE